MEDTGIKYPISLDIDMRGQLWVGCHQVNSLMQQYTK